jgi:peroxiredoxin Q/BCP
MSANVGAHAPDFMLKDGDGREWRLSEQKGRVVVLLFYPGDETPVCTKQMCSVRDNWEQYQETGAEVVGVSTDSSESHKKFAEHHSLPLRLLSDPDRRVSEMYGAKSWLPGRSARSVVVIDSEGRVRHNKAQSLSLFRPKDDEVLAAIRAAKGSDK